MSSLPDPNLAHVELIAAALGPLLPELVFVGGSAAGLLVSQSSGVSIRATRDVDVVAAVSTRADYHELENAIRERGFLNDMSPDAPICRWVKAGVRLDVMPSIDGVLGFHNRWYPLVVETAQGYELPGGSSIRLVAAPAFIATKFEAFDSRGGGDMLASHDLEDILLVMAGRSGVLTEVANAPAEIRKFVATRIRDLLADQSFLESLPGHFPRTSETELNRFLSMLEDVGNLL